MGAWWSSKLSVPAVIILPVLLTWGCASAKTKTVHTPGREFISSKPADQIDESLSDSAVPAGEEEFEGADGAAPPTARDEQGTSKTKGENGEGEESLLDTALEYTETAREEWAGGNADKALEALDQAYALILRVDPGDNALLIQRKEDIRFTISKRIMEIHASRFATVKGNHKAIPLTVNAHVEREIRQFQTVDRDFLIESYKRSGRYRGEIVKALKEAGLPEELSWLPLIESGFKVRALSRARALGLWQFIPSTGYKFGLKRNEWIDERLDPVKSTAAAIAYLKELHQIFGDWATVLAAYNCGEGTVLRVIRDQKINYLDNFWDLYERLPYETARYYPRFLATLAILKKPEGYGIALEGPESPVPYETATIEKQFRLNSAAEHLGVSLEALTALNPELRHAATPPSPYALKVPAGMGETLLAGLDAIAKWSPPKTAFTYHRVRRGETLSHVAMRYHTSIRRILEANRLRGSHLIRVGQKLKVPLNDAS